MKRWQRRVGILLITLVLVFFARRGLDAWYQKSQNEVRNQKGWVDVDQISAQSAGHDQEEKEDQLFFLLAGVDWDPDNHENQHTRTDTLMLVKVDFPKGEIRLVSLPRDSYVPVQGKMTKLTHAHYYGGMDLTLRTIRDWLGLDVEDYVEVNYQAVERIVDGMGGIEYTIPDNGIDYHVFDTNHKYKTLKPGKQVLNGAEALGYLRFRKGYINGDLGRVEAQQAFLKHFVNQVLSSNHIKMLPTLVTTVFNDVDTNISWTRIMKALGSLEDLKGGRMESSILPGDGAYYDGISYYVTDPQGTQAIIQENFPEYLFGGQAYQERIENR